MNRSQARWLLVIAAVVLWVLAIVPGYYAVHKPLAPRNLMAMANVAADLATWLAMLAVATALGARLTRRLAYHSLLERLVFSAGLGLICTSMLTFGLGLVGLLYRWLFWILLAGGGALLWRDFRDLGQALGRVTWPRPQGRWATFLSLFIVTTLLSIVPLALTPPINWDSLLYHLVGPDRYLQAHRLTFEFDNYLLFFPSFTEMLFTVGMGLKSDVIPRLVHFGYLLLTLGALGAFAARFWERRLGLLASALFLSFPTAVYISTRAYVDIALAFYMFAALYALLIWLPQKNFGVSQEQVGTSHLGWLILTGLFCGASASVKYNGVMGSFAVGGVLAWALLRRRLPARRCLSGALVIAGLTLATAAPWYLKNIIVAGNPVYPMAWGGQEWNEVSARWLEPAGPTASLPELVVLPWRLTVLGQEGTVAYDITLSPLFLTLLPLLLLVRRRAPALGELLLATAIGYVFWIASGLIATKELLLKGRWLVPIFVPMSLLCAYALEGLRAWDRENFSLRRVLIMLAALTMGLSLVSQVLLTVGLDPVPYLVGTQSREEYLDRYVSQRFHQTATYLNENLTDQDRVFFIWEPRSYGLQVPHRADVLLDHFSQYLARYGSPVEMIAGLSREGFTHLLVNEYIYPWIVVDFPISPDEQAAWEELQAFYLTEDALVHAEGEYLGLYDLTAMIGQ